MSPGHWDFSALLWGVSPIHKPLFLWNQPGAYTLCWADQPDSSSVLYQRALQQTLNRETGKLRFKCEHSP